MTEPVESTPFEHTAQRLTDLRRVLAYGGFDGVARRPLLHEHGTYPHFARAAHGYEIVDSTGRTFVDFVNGWGPVLLGYGHRVVDCAIREQLGCGPTLSLMHEVELDVALLLTEMFPCAEMVAFGKNGSDVLTAAARVARACTGRRIFLHYGMHGFHDWFICSLTQFRGLPDELRPLIHSFRYNDPAGLEALFARFDGQVAAVVMEPVREEMPHAGYLERVRELCDRNGALLVWDEVVTALRVAPGGAQELFGVTPDLACLGKALGNGMPLAALVGRRRFMQHLPSVGFGMTFRGETLSLAAARAVLKFVRDENVPRKLAVVGEELRARFAALADSKGVHCRLTGPPQRMTIVFQDTSTLDADRQRALLVQECLKRGLMTNGNMLLSFAHDAKALERALHAFDGAFDVLALAQKTGRVELDSCARGFIESVIEEPDALVLAGWCLLDDGAPDAIVARLSDGSERRAEVFSRPDVEAAYPTTPRASSAGFSLRIPWDANGSAAFLLCLQRGETTRFRCHVTRERGTPLRPGAPYDIEDGVALL